MDGPRMGSLVQPSGEYAVSRGTSAQNGPAPSSVILVTVAASTPEQLTLALNTTVGLRFLGHCSSTRPQAALLRHHGPDAVLIDEDGGPQHVLARIREARTHVPQAKVVLLVASSEGPWVVDAMEAGSHGVLVKDVPPVSLALMLREIIRGTVFHGLAAPLSHGANGLTGRECDVLALVAVGASNREIARRLAVSPETVKFHLSNLYRKLHVANRTAAGRWAYAHGWVAEGGGRELEAHLRRATHVGFA